jgi:hypothetical protein
MMTRRFLSDVYSDCFTATNLKREWRQCYLEAMGLVPSDWEDDDDEENLDLQNTEAKRTRLTIVNLLPLQVTAEQSELSESRHKQSTDTWSTAALQIQSNILEMSEWIHKKQWDFVSVNMPDDEASLIASTVTSFIPTTANEIESLRQMINSVQNMTQQQHRMGIVQILMSFLKECVADPFGIFQKQRSRTAVAFWQNPLQCRLMTYTASCHEQGDDDLDSALGISSAPRSAQELQRQQRFLPTRPVRQLQGEFMNSYRESLKRKRRPSSVLFDKRTEPYKSAAKPALRASEDISSARNQTVPDSSLSFPDIEPQPEPDFYLSPATLQHESLLFAVHHDLDSVQQMEQRMVDITALLSQFASLVTEQQEFVQEIYEVTSDAKANVDKGQEELLKAKETVQAGKHYTAKAITAMGILMLVLHWVVP